MRLSLAPILLPFCLHAQLPAPNSMGVAMGHLHLNTTDTDASRKFWVDFMGGSVVKLGTAEVYKFPDALVMVRKTAVSGPSEGSVINHLGFKVRDLNDYRSRCEKLGFKVAQFTAETQQMFVMSPDEVKVELTGDPGQTAPIVHHHIHFFDTAVLETQAWYGRMFGAKPGKRGRFDAADLPGVNLSFSLAKDATAPTKGRAMDHFGFEVKNLEQFVKQMEEKGVKFDVPYRKVPQLGIAIAFFTDPWGTYVELTEGLDKL